MSRRTAGSVRFDPYWKVQYWDSTSLTWRDIQKAHHDQGDAWAAAEKEEDERGTWTRLMEITEDGRRPLSRDNDPRYCRQHDLYDCPYAHEPRRIR